MRIAFITDTHLGDTTPTSRGIDPEKNLDSILDHIAEKDADLLVFAGDITQPGRYPEFFSKLADICPDQKTILGNHDDHDEVVKHFTHPSASDTELYYSYEDVEYKFIYLDSSSAHISDTQFDWLAKEVGTDKTSVVFIHHPVLGLDTGMDHTYPLQGRQRINALLQQCQKPVTVFCGHYHMPDARQDGNITQYITPAVSFQVNKASQVIDINVDSFGYRIIDIGERISTSLFINSGNGFIEEEDTIG